MKSSIRERSFANLAYNCIAMALSRMDFTSSNSPGLSKSTTGSFVSNKFLHDLYSSNPDKPYLTVRKQLGWPCAVGELVLGHTGHTDFRQLFLR